MDSHKEFQKTKRRRNEDSTPQNSAKKTKLTDAEKQEDLKKRVATVAMNRELAFHAKRKDLEKAKAVFEKLIGQECVNVHSIAAVLNAYVRCGDLRGAKEVFDQYFVSSDGSKPRMRLDVVSCTTLLKGYCGMGDMTSAKSVIDLMMQMRPPVVPNIRTANTYLRGCVTTGHVTLATAFFSTMQKDYKLVPDVSSWEYMVGLYAQALMTDNALPIVGRLKGDSSGSMVPGLGAMYMHIARAFALKGDFKSCRKHLRNASEALEKWVQQELADEANEAEADADDRGSIDEQASDAEHDDEDGRAIKTSKQTAAGGKRAWKQSDPDDARGISLKVCLSHISDG